MNSLKALYELYCASKWSKNRFELVRDDLVVLDILKKRVNLQHFNVCFGCFAHPRNIHRYNDFFDEPYHLTPQEFYAIAKWLYGKSFEELGVNESVTKEEAKQ